MGKFIAAATLTLTLSGCTVPVAMAISAIGGAVGIVKDVVGIDVSLAQRDQTKVPLGRVVPVVPVPAGR